MLSLIHILLNALDQVFFAVDERRHQLRGVDVAAAHFKKMGGRIRKKLLGKLVDIVDLADRHDGICLSLIHI